MNRLNHFDSDRQCHLLIFWPCLVRLLEPTIYLFQYFGKIPFHGLFDIEYITCIQHNLNCKSLEIITDLLSLSIILSVLEFSMPSAKHRYNKYVLFSDISPLTIYWNYLGDNLNEIWFLKDRKKYFTLSANILCRQLKHIHTKYRKLSIRRPGSNKRPPPDLDVKNGDFFGQFSKNYSLY